MRSPFIYSVLQYHHSIFLGEAINVGIVFLFPYEQQIKFRAGNSQRLKLIYKDFDATVYNYLTKSISRKLDQGAIEIWPDLTTANDLKRFINDTLLPEDATALRFVEPVSVLATKGDHPGQKALDNTMDELCALLLPDIQQKKKNSSRHSDQFLLKKFTDYLTRENHEIEKKLLKHQTIKARVDNREIELKFDIVWKNGSTNFVKPLSFDLSEEKSIQDKSMMNYAYLDLISDYARMNNYRFDFIVAQPQDRSLYKSYENALGLLELTDAPKRIISEEELESYSEEARLEILNH